MFQMYSASSNKMPPSIRNTPHRNMSCSVWDKKSICNERLDTSSHFQTVYNHSKVTGSVLYYARAVDLTVLIPLNDIATDQTKATEKTQVAHKSIVRMFGDSPRRHHQASCFRYYIQIHGDASYLSVSNARIRLGGLFFCGDKPHKRILSMVPSLMWHQL
jgi:hypothetical protein